MVRWARAAYVVLAWAFLAGLMAQTFVIGLGLFGDKSFREVHAGLGWILHLAPLLVLLAAVLARAGKRHWQWALAMAVVVLIVPILATLRDTAAIAALHPVGAVIAFALAVVVALNSWRSLRAGPG